MDFDEIIKRLEERYTTVELVEILDVGVSDLAYNFEDLVYSKLEDLDINFNEEDIDVSD